MSIASYLEHTNLTPTLTDGDIDRLVEEAVEHNLLGICVPPFWVKRARREVGSRSPLVVTVAGFPLGYSMTETKLDEISRAIDNGADEVDIVLNISAFKTGMPWVKVEVAKCSKLLHENQKVLKVIIETAYLTDDEVVSASKLCADAGADFVKTSTGFAPSGANAKHIMLMRQALPDSVGIKASGGIKTLESARDMIAAGATRIGTSSGVAIVNEEKLHQP
ncbi:MAG TPA: deoxyribose-phosphate aldolase [Ohtaekwangia sp.]|nr:deoxyribose-phosphate aldolase [Ohtaekwangia sp.]